MGKVKSSEPSWFRMEKCMFLHPVGEIARYGDRDILCSSADMATSVAQSVD